MLIFVKSCPVRKLLSVILLLFLSVGLSSGQEASQRLIFTVSGTVTDAGVRPRLHSWKAPSHSNKCGRLFRPQKRQGVRPCRILIPWLQVQAPQGSGSYVCFLAEREYPVGGVFHHQRRSSLHSNGRSGQGMGNVLLGAGAS